MSTSPKSEVTVLLWGDSWWLPGQPLPVPFADWAQAAETLASVWSEGRRDIRLIYQPDRLATVALPCPNGSRATLAMALSEQLPALDDQVWSHEPILAGNGSFNTLIHHENWPGLPVLVQDLEHRGFSVSSVWPMATWLNALPEEVSDSGAASILALHTDRFCLYRHGIDGKRFVEAAAGADALTRAASLLQDNSIGNASEPVLLVTTDPALTEPLKKQGAVAEDKVAGVLTLDEALARPATLPVRHPAQLLRAAMRLATLSSALRAMNVAAILAVSLLGADLAHRHWTQQNASAAAMAERETLRAEVARGHQRETEILQLRAQKAALAPDPLPWSGFLGLLTRGLPSQVVFTRLRADRTGFRLDGGVSDSALPEPTWAAWIENFRAAEAPWDITSLPEAIPDGAFAIRGEWQ